ncbi:MAG TPA: DUF5701 family protein [bacterium]|nr:DUF5701 family protein [bacterium]
MRHLPQLRIKRAPTIWLSGGVPRLGCWWAPHTWLGNATGEVRSAPPYGRVDDLG